MWICFNDAFVSIVEYQNADADVGMSKLLVRARRREHLVAFLGVEFATQITVTPDRDYRFRAVVSRSLVAMILSKRAWEIDYGNFKDSVEDADLHRMYALWWGDHVKLTSDAENLDGMCDEDLIEFKQTHKGPLAKYAGRALLARAARRNGRIVQALKHERAMGRIYDSLPLDQRW